MASINSVVLVGNLTKDPDLRHTAGGTPVCAMRIAVNDRGKDASGEWVDKPYYFDVSVWGNQGESCATHLSKGRRIGIQGKLTWREWEAQDGTKRQSVEINAYTVMYLDPKPGSGGSGGSDFQRAEGEPRPTDEPDFVPAAGYDDDIPF